MVARTCFLFAATFCATCSATLQAGVITPFSATGTSAVYGSPTEVINGDGLSGTGSILTQLANEDPAPGDSGLPVGVTSGEWLVPATSGLSITFDLGAVYTVGALDVWNYAEDTALSVFFNAARGAQSVDVLASPTNPSPVTLVQSFTFSEATYDALPTQYSVSAPYFYYSYEVPVVEYTFTTPVTARYFTFDINSNWGDSGYTGLSEVRFTTVPEPTSCVLFGIAAAGLLAVAYRRRRAR